MKIISSFSKVKYVLSVVALWLMIAFSAVSALADDDKVVAIIYLSDIPLYHEVADWIEDDMKSSGIETKKIVLQKDGKLYAELPKNSILITIGDFALRFSLENLPGYPGLSFMAYNSQVIKQAIATNNWLVLPLYASPDMRVSFLKQQISDIKTVATIYTERFRDEINEVKATLSSAGILLNAVEVTDGADAISVTAKLFQENDCFMIYHDAAVNNKILIDQLLKLQHDNKKPVIGLSQKFVQQGVLMAITYDLKYIPYLAKRLVSGALKNKEEIAREIQKGYVIYVNEHAARNMNLKFPARIQDVHVEIIS